ncbi:hypothetical protein [Moraxella lacunata]|uniref:hypothetical protein n=1 Tax=Moraxella lacunata TaxID=477 RepID=UPI003EE2E162
MIHPINFKITINVMLYGCRGVLSTPIKLVYYQRTCSARPYKACGKYQIRWV